MNKTTQDFLSLIKTREDLVSFLMEIDEINRALYTKGFRTKLKRTISEETFKILEKDLSKMGWELSKMKNYLKELKEQISQVKTAEITLAFKPSKEFLNTLSVWTRSNLGENVVPDVIIDQSIIAGVKVVYQGRIKDYSFNKILKNSMESEKERILSCLA